MKDVVKEMLAHPIASLVIIGALGSAVAGIISAAKGTKTPTINPTINLCVNKENEESATTEGDEAKA